MPCHALRSSCFVDPWGVVYPCISYSKPVGRLRDTAMRLADIWNAPATAELQEKSGRAIVRNAGPPAKHIRAFSVTSWPDDGIGVRRLAGCADRRDPGARPMNVDLLHGRRACRHTSTERSRITWRADVSGVIAAKQEARTIEQMVRRCERYAGEIVVVVGRSTDGTGDIAGRSGANVLADRGKGKGDAIRCAIPSHPHTDHRFSRCRWLARSRKTSRCSSSRSLPIEADHVTASRLRGGSSELHGGFDEFFRLAGSSFITACINWRFGCRLSDSQNGFRAIRTERAAEPRPARGHAPPSSRR